MKSPQASNDNATTKPKTAPRQRSSAPRLGPKQPCKVLSLYIVINVTSVYLVIVRNIVILF